MVIVSEIIITTETKESQRMHQMKSLKTILLKKQFKLKENKRITQVFGMLIVIGQSILYKILKPNQLKM